MAKSISGRTGHGATVVVDGFTANIKRMEPLNMTSEVLVDSHLETDYPYHVLRPSDLVRIEPFDMDIEFLPTQTVKILIVDPAAKITFGDGTEWRGPGWIVNYNAGEQETDVLMNGIATFQFDGTSLNIYDSGGTLVGPIVPPLVP